MEYHVDVEGGREFRSLFCFAPVGYGFGETFIVEEAWDGGWVAHTTGNSKKTVVQGDTMLQAWRKMKRLLATQDQWGNVIVSAEKTQAVL